MADPQPVKVPPTFKALLPFIRRAEELDRDTSRPESKLIAYFCRQYAMELGIKLRENDASNETTDYLLSLMDRLENEKDRLPDFTQEEGKEICEDFAMEIFAKADDEDRAGMANKSTARTFYAAGTFFDILHQFGDVSEDVMEKRRYCKYKAATILKAIKNGVAPTPGPPGEADMKAADDGIDDAATMSTASQFSSAPAMLKSDFSPPQRVEPTPSTSLTESVRSAGAMSASELNNALHGLSSTQPSTPSSNQGHSAPVSQYAAPTNPASSYQPSTVPTSAYQPPSAPASSTYQPPFAAASSTYQPTASSSSAPTPPSPTAALPAPTPPSPTAALPAPTPPSPTPAPPAPTLPSPTPPSPSAHQPLSTPASPYQSRLVQQTPARTRNTPVSQNEINDAIEYAKFAVAALKVKDMKLAEERLEMALRNIRGA